jgi:molybdate transport system substrate-binding protein
MFVALARVATMLVVGAFTVGPALAETLTVLAAASTVEAVEEALGRFRAAHDQQIQASYASSSALARQIEYGAPADIFISANTRWMDYLAEQGHVAAALRRDLLTNELVWIAPDDGAPAPASLDALGTQLGARLGAGRLAVGDPDHVPAGMYARQALETLGLWDVVRDRLAPAQNVRVALMLVARGEAPLGIVYRTDATAAAGVRIIDALPAASHAPIVYPIAVVRGHQRETVRSLFDFLTSAEAAEVFRRHGFGIP